VAGLRLTASVDTATLPAEDAAHILQLVEAAGLSELEHMPDQSPGADRFQYRLRIESARRGTRTATLSESAVPDRLRPLLEFLTDLALQRGGSGRPTELPDNQAS
jgi:hypothetical protein